MKIAVIFATGFEEIEALSVVDILRRAELEALIVGLDAAEITGAHGVSVKADMTLDELNVREFDMIVLPGGLPGAKFLANSQKLGDILNEFDRNDAKIAAICAAPWALATAGVLKDHYTCYPGFEAQVGAPGYTAEANVVVDQNIITSRGPATAMEFALILVRELCGNEKYTEIKNGLLFA